MRCTAPMSWGSGTRRPVLSDCEPTDAEVHFLGSREVQGSFAGSLFRNREAETNQTSIKLSRAPLARLAAAEARHHASFRFDRPFRLGRYDCLPAGSKLPPAASTCNPICRLFGSRANSSHFKCASDGHSGAVG
jgi:hypothetical protein